VTAGACRCDECRDPQVVTNPPGLSTIAYRVDDFAGFRRALLRPLDGEVALGGWRPATNDLGLQLLEWWAYLGDVLTFYNERIANESYLRTAELPSSVSALVALLGYTPRPAVAAVGQVAALRRKSHPSEPLVVPSGFQLANTATPGVTVQTWEAAAASFTGLSDSLIVQPPSPKLLSPTGATSPIGSVLLAGAVANLKAGDELLLVSKSFPERADDWAKVTVVSSTPGNDPNGGKNTTVVLNAPDLDDVPAWILSANAADVRLMRSRQTASLWTQGGNLSAFTSASSTTVTVELSAAVRAISPGDLVFVDDRDGIVTTLGVVSDTSEIFTAVKNPSGGKQPDIPIAHTELTLTTELASAVFTPHYEYVVSGGKLVSGSGYSILHDLYEPAAVAVRYAFRDIGSLIGVPAQTLAALPATVTPKQGDFSVPAGGTAAFVEDVNGDGIPVFVTDNEDGTLTLAASTDTPPSFSLAVPLRLLVDLVDVSRGQTVASEQLGTGDASVAGQRFTLKNAPLSYLQSAADVVSTLRIAVDEIYWTEAKTFYAQTADATVFVVTALADGTSSVRFGDGINGARLPSGSNVVATYRYGAGVAKPPAGRLTTILKPQQNLASIHNPVAVWGGADAEQPQDVRTDAPKSVLSFGRAISADDYETVAALAPGVTRARAYWAWDAAHQRSLVKVYVGDDAGAATSARNALLGAEDPNRPVAVEQAMPIEVTVTGTLEIEPNYVAADVVAAASAALSDPMTGLFAAARMAIGQPLYSSQLEAALLVPGAVAVHGLFVTADDSDIFAGEPVGWADPGAESFYVLASSALSTEVAGA
jgi:hypothetical protein